MGACEAEKQTLGGCEGRSINVGVDLLVGIVE